MSGSIVTVSPMLLQNEIWPLEEAPKHFHSTKAEVVPAKYEEAVTALEQCLTLKRYSGRTVKGYKNCFRQFIRHYNDIKPSQITRKQIDDYILGLIKEKHITESYQNQILSAIKMFCVEVVKQDRIRPAKCILQAYC